MMRSIAEEHDSKPDLRAVEGTSFQYSPGRPLSSDKIERCPSLRHRACLGVYQLHNNPGTRDRTAASSQAPSALHRLPPSDGWRSLDVSLLPLQTAAAQRRQHQWSATWSRLTMAEAAGRSDHRLLD